MVLLSVGFLIFTAVTTHRPKAVGNLSSYSERLRKSRKAMAVVLACLLIIVTIVTSIETGFAVYSFKSNLKASYQAPANCSAQVFPNCAVWNTVYFSDPSTNKSIASFMILSHVVTTNETQNAQRTVLGVEIQIVHPQESTVRSLTLTLHPRLGCCISFGPGGVGYSVPAGMSPYQVQTVSGQNDTQIVKIMDFGEIGKGNVTFGFGLLFSGNYTQPDSTNPATTMGMNMVVDAVSAFPLFETNYSGNYSMSIGRRRAT